MIKYKKTIKTIVLCSLFSFPVLASAYTGLPLKANCDQFIHNKSINICYDYKAKGAKYVWYTLSSNTVNLKNIKKRPSFYSDGNIPSQYRTDKSDYTRNSFHADRGHLAPDADFDFSDASLHNVYTMANIIPQYYRINRYTWIKAEKYERYVTHKLENVTVLNGVEYGNYDNVMSNGIVIPIGFWKQITDSKGFERCFYYKNEKITKEDAKNDKLRDHVVDCKLLK